MNQLNPNLLNSRATKPMPTLNQKPITPIINRFKLLLKNRQDKFKADDYNNVVPAPSSDEIVMFYDVVLSELTLNSKPIITDLTIIADDMRDYGQAIADVICARILEVYVCCHCVFVCWSYKVFDFTGFVLLLCLFLACIVITIMDDNNV